MPDKYIDSANTIDTPIKNYKDLSDGSLLLWSRVARTGEYDYGTHKQVITTDSLFEAESLNTLIGLPVTLHHPPSFIETTDDRRKYGIGVTLQEIVKEEGTTDSEENFLTIASVIWDKTAIEGIKNKTINQFSPGYYANKTQDSASGRIIQSERRYNHIALTPSGRGGSEVAALVDSIDPVARLVELHTQYRDSLISAGVEPSYKWSALELKRNILNVLTGKDTSKLSEENCDALMEFLPESKPVKAAVPEITTDSNLLTSAEKLYIERITSAYKAPKR